MLADLIDWSKLDTVEVDGGMNLCTGCVFDTLDSCPDSLTSLCMKNNSSYIFIKKEQP